jgi:hypothetical protein
MALYYTMYLNCMSLTSHTQTCWDLNQATSPIFQLFFQYKFMCFFKLILKEVLEMLSLHPYIYILRHVEIPL